ncbi:MAG: Tim44/TimA family putative adaptor protein [Alphaproteobacteria bacterium]
MPTLKEVVLLLNPKGHVDPVNLDIILFAGLALFLVFRLRDLLGRSSGRDKLDHPFGTMKGENADQRSDSQTDDGFDPSTYDPKEHEQDETNVVDLHKSKGKTTSKSVEVFHDDPQINATIFDIRKLDRDFHPDTFVQGAEMAYEMVINGFAAGDLEELRGLMSAQVFNDFKNAIEQRVNAGETLETTLVGFDKVEIIGASLQDKTAEIEVMYTTQQINIVRDANGDMIDEDDAHVASQQDRWTLVRKLTSKDPNWTLVSLATVGDS